MARTPLFRILQRSYAQARKARRTGKPVREVVERERESRQAPGISRRQFLGGAAATAGLALAGCRSALGTAGRPLSGRRAEVLIVGAGIAGLTAGYRLQQAGVPARILEAQDRVGGRMYSLREFFPDRQVAELGGELIDTGHVHMRRLAEELGIPLDDFALDGSLPNHSGPEPELHRDVWFFDGRRITEEDIVEAFVPVSDRIVRDLASLDAPWVSYREPNGAGALDRLSLAEWLDRAGVSGWFRKLLDVGYTTEFGLEADRQSCLGFLLMIDPNPRPFRIYGGSDERFHVRGGNDRIPLALAEKLAGQIDTGVRLEAVSQDADGSLRCSVRRGQTSEELRAGHLILAIPFTLLREVRLDVELTPVKRQAIRELGYGTNAKLMAGFSERVWRAPGPNGRSNGSTLTDLPYQLCWETSRLQPGRHGILTNFTGGNHGVELGEGTAAEQAERFARQLDRIFPGVAARRSGMKEARFHWPSFPWTKGSYACYLPGQWTAFAGVEGERAGNIHFAGEHCSAEAAGFMEGGCETGERAAREILADLQVRAPMRTAVQERAA